jgi:uncharacterized membrane protein YbaN (DUF454 family)
MLQPVQTILWRTLAVAALVMGAIGIALPVLPTVPFWILAAWAAGKGWPSLQRWLVNHRRYGAAIRNWQERGAVPRRAKWLASVMMLTSALLLQLTSVLVWVKLAVPAAMLVVCLWLWRRPE